MKNVSIGRHVDISKKKIQKAYKIIHGIKYKISRLIDIVHTKLRLWGNGVQCKSYRIVGIPYIETSKGGKIVFGNNLDMNNGMMANQIGFNTPCTLRAENGGSIIIGENVGMSQTTLVAKGANITIGNNVKLGGGVKIYTTDFHCLDYMKRREPEVDMTKRQYAPVTVGDDCFIGAGVIILKGVKIGDRSIVGAGSVVTKDIPADCIAGGNPCKVIKQIEGQY